MTDRTPHVQKVRESVACWKSSTPRKWGGKDVGDNSQFWHAATIEAVRWDRHEQVATVRFHHDGRLSAGHFVWAMRDA